MQAVVAGGDPDGLADALREAGADVRRADGTADRDALEAAGLADADALLITDAGLATAIPVAKELNPDVRIVVYDRDSVPEFARAGADLILDPDLMDAGTVVDGLLR